MKEKIFVAAVVGPTASGKTKLGVNLAKKFRGEVISADSMQIYKELNISTSKPTKIETEGIPHHLMDIRSVCEEYSASDFKSDAEKLITKIVARGKMPIFVGGTGLYLDALFQNFDFNKRQTEEIPEVRSMTNEKLHEELTKIDEISSKKIHVNDRRRLIRACEFFETFGFPISRQKKIPRSQNCEYNVCKIGLNFKNRAILYEKIGERVDKMLEQGLVDEVAAVSNMNPGKTAVNAIGYKEILEFIRGELNLKEAAEKLKKATRNYAKRQLTWFRRDEDINWFYVDEYENFEDLTKDAGEYAWKRLGEN